MRALVQRVTCASVDVDERRVATIAAGLLVLLGISHEDDAAAADRLADKVRALRIFEDADGRMNEALGEREILCVSQFTLYGDTGKGNRPSFVAAAPGETPGRCMSASASVREPRVGSSARTCASRSSTTAL